MSEAELAPPLLDPEPEPEPVLGAAAEGDGAAGDGEGAAGEGAGAGVSAEGAGAAVAAAEAEGTCSFSCDHMSSAGRLTTTPTSTPTDAAAEEAAAGAVLVLARHVRFTARRRTGASSRTGAAVMEVARRARTGTRAERCIVYRNCRD